MTAADETIQEARRDARGTPAWWKGTQDDRELRAHLLGVVGPDPRPVANLLASTGNWPDAEVISTIDGLVRSGRLVRVRWEGEEAVRKPGF